MEEGTIYDDNEYYKDYVEKLKKIQIYQVLKVYLYLIIKKKQLLQQLC